MATYVESYDKAFEGYGTTVTATAPAAAAVRGGGDGVVGAATTPTPMPTPMPARAGHWYSYLQTWDFWIVVAVGQVLSLCITATNTFTTFLTNNGTNIPAFQTLFNYVLLSLIYVPITFYRKGWRYVLRTVLLRDGWKYFVLSFLDVEGNYFTVLAYEYTNILSAQLLNFWSIVCVVLLSCLLLRVRYRPFQIAGILLACGGMGLLLASDHITGANGGPTVDKVKGDLFGLLGASLYGMSNVFEEWFVSKKPAYEVLACLGVFGCAINGVQAAIFDRASIQHGHAHWSGAVAGYLVGYTLALTLFYTLAPLILRMGSAAFFDISLLTANFWGVIIGIHVFGDAVHFLYPIAFVLILCGLVVYFLAGSLLGDAKKPWLGANQEAGVAGVGTAKRKALQAARKQGLAGGAAAAADPEVADGVRPAAERV
ncbi:solute carrier protein [Niveomyces insectorum RCEF 264]|uniref:Solute carrier protein n=1 Tax=Niveomyces insectorum RCEF 264 TaxID=1081102 RepID=A0A167TAH2_9HYPO|nr:solute carrier protein [Niveomyces insectorum RCEF 264]